MKELEKAFEDLFGKSLEMVLRKKLAVLVSKDLEGEYAKATEWLLQLPNTELKKIFDCDNLLNVVENYMPYDIKEIHEIINGNVTGYYRITNRFTAHKVGVPKSASNVESEQFKQIRNYIKCGNYFKTQLEATAFAEAVSESADNLKDVKV